MKDENKTKEQLISELVVLRQQVAELESLKDEYRWGESVYHTLVEHSFQGLAILQGSSVVFANSAVAEMVGHTVEELMSLSAEELTAVVHPDDQGFVWGRYRDRLAGKQAPSRYEFRMIRKDGVVRWMEVSSSHIEYRGEPAVQAAFVDITERKRAEEALKESEKRFQDVLLASADWIWEVDRETRYTYTSGKVKEILGYDPNEIIGKTPFEITLKDEAGKIREFFKKIGSEKKPIVDFESWNVTKEGKEVCLLTNGVPILSEKGELLGYRGVDKDITERKRAEEALRESEEKYRVVVENANEAIVVAQDGMLKFFNPKVIEITNYSKKELSSKPFMELLHPDNREMVVERHLSRLKGEDIPHIYHFRIVDKYGNTKWVEVNAVIISWAGKPATLNFLSDITKRKRAEEELRRKNEELENFIYTVSHDLKSPLITLQGFVSALTEDYGDKLDGEAKRYLGFIRDASGRMGTLIRDLLELSRVGKAVHPEKDVDFSAVVEESLKILSSRVEEKGIELVVSDEFPRVRCDRRRMVQVLENLLSNAIKFMGENPSPRIEIGNREEDGCHRFWVRDNGIGLDPQYHGRIFELFQSLMEVRDEEGTGVGLTIARKIIEHHAGRIWVESAKGEGSTFYFTLPKMSGKPKGESP